MWGVGYGVIEYGDMELRGVVNGGTEVGDSGTEGGIGVVYGL